jgi:hypothetical protein
MALKQKKKTGNALLITHQNPANFVQPKLVRPRITSPELKLYESFKYLSPIFEDYVYSKESILGNREIRKRSRRDLHHQQPFTTPKISSTSSTNHSSTNSANTRLWQKRLDEHLAAMNLAMRCGWTRMLHA